MEEVPVLLASSALREGDRLDGEEFLRRWQATPGLKHAELLGRMPDLFLRILPEHGGQSRIEGSLATGAPEPIVEVSGSSLSRDLGIKLDLYRQVGVSVPWFSGIVARSGGGVGHAVLHPRRLRARC